MDVTISKRQREVCHKYATDFCPPLPQTKVGLAQNIRTELEPLNGLRHLPDGDTCGWYIWRGGELSQEDDFFQPTHVEHLNEECPEAAEFLALPPGWRFLVAGGQVDVWFDQSLLEA